MGFLNTWLSLDRPPETECRCLLLMSSGVTIAGWYIHSKFIPDHVNNLGTIEFWSKNELIKE